MPDTATFVEKADLARDAFLLAYNETMGKTPSEGLKVVDNADYLVPLDHAKRFLTLAMARSSSPRVTATDLGTSKDIEHRRAVRHDTVATTTETAPAIERS